MCSRELMRVRPRESKTQIYVVIIAAIVFLLMICVPRFTPSERTGPPWTVLIRLPSPGF